MSEDVKSLATDEPKRRGPVGASGEGVNFEAGLSSQFSPSTLIWSLIFVVLILKIFLG